MRVETEADRFVHDQLLHELRPNEVLECAAYMTSQFGSVASALMAKAYWAAFSNQRLFLIEARVGATSALMENGGVRHYDRTQVTAAVSGNTVLLKLPDGELSLIAKDAKVTSHKEFLELLRLQYGQTAAGQQLASQARKKGLLSLVVGLLIAGAYLTYVMYFGKAQVEVSCKGVESGVECTLVHKEGGATANVQWDVEIRCANGTLVVGHARDTVKPRETRRVVLAASQLEGISKCDTGNSIEVKRMTVK